MKFIVNWNSRPASDPGGNVAAAETVLNAFSGWSPPDSMDITEFVARVDGRGGTVICETDDLAAIDLFVAQYAAWFDYDVYPVLDIAEGAAQFGQGTAWAKAALG